MCLLESDSSGAPTSAANCAFEYQDLARRLEDDGPLSHLLHQVAVRLLDTVQCVDLVAVGAPDDERIDLAVTKGLERLLGFSEACEGVSPAARGASPCDRDA